MHEAFEAGRRTKGAALGNERAQNSCATLPVAHFPALWRLRQPPAVSLPPLSFRPIRHYASLSFTPPRHWRPSAILGPAHTVIPTRRRNPSGIALPPAPHT